MEIRIILCAVMFPCLCTAAMAQQAPSRSVRVAELQIDPAQAEAFAAATREVGQASVRLEEGCLVLYAVAERDNPSFVRVFEIYRDRLHTRHTCKLRTFRNSVRRLTRW